MRWRWLPLLLLASCLAKTPASGDAGTANDLCVAAGGVCSAPTGCLAQVGDIQCLGGSLCCLANPGTDAAGPASDAPPAAVPLPSVPVGVDASSGSSSSASACDLTCEGECVNDPNCIQACGC